MTTAALHNVLYYLESLSLSSSDKRWLAEHYFGAGSASLPPIISAKEVSAALTVDEVEERLLNMAHDYYSSSNV